MTKSGFSGLLQLLPNSLRSRLSGKGGLVIFGAGARAFAMASQLIVMLIMSWMLPKSAFGDAMIAFTLYRLLGMAIGTGAGNLLLYHVSRAGGDHQLDIRLGRTLTAFTLVLSGLLTAALVVLSDPIASLFNKPELSIWLLHMSPVVIFGSLNLVTAASFDGRSRVTHSIVLTEVMPNALRLAGFPLLAVLALPDIWIGHVLWASLALPWLWDARRLLEPSVRGFAPLVWWDGRYATWSGVNSLLGQQLQGLDMIIVGALFSSTTVAEYSIASRLATLYPFLQLIAVRGFIPRAGHLVAQNKIEELNLELSSLRSWSLVLVATMAAAIIGPSFLYLPMFGDYGQSSTIMIGLAAASLMRCMFVGIDVALRMTGKAGYSALISASSAAVIIGCSVLLHGPIGIQALSASMFLSAAIVNFVSATIINRSGIIVADRRATNGVVIGFIGIAAALWIDSSQISPVLCCLFLLLSAGTTYRRAKSNVTA